MTDKPRRPPGSDSVYQRASDGRFIAAHVNPDGSRITASSRRSKAEALKRLRERLRRLATTGQEPRGADQTLRDYLRSWLQDVVYPNRAPNTANSYESACRCHIVPALGDIPLSELSPQDVQRLLSGMARAGKSLSLQRAVKVILTTALNRALKWGLVPRNAASLADTPRKPKTERQILPAEMLPAFLDACRSHRLGALYVLAVTAGLRSGELIGLRWDCVDLDAGTLRIQQQLQHIDGRAVFCDVKRARSRRVVWLPQVAVEALRRHRTRQKEERLLAGALWQDHGLVFCSPGGRPLYRARVRRILCLLLEAAHLPSLTVHELRHSYATHLITQGVDPRTAAELLGHASTAITLDIYSHSSPQAKRAAARALDALYASQS